MADGDYERRGPREAELKRLRRIIEAAKANRENDYSKNAQTPLRKECEL